MFPNLEAEMARKNLVQADFAKALKLNLSTMNSKLNVTGRLKFTEAAAIRDNFFPDLSLDYLFQTRSLTNAH